MPDASRDGPTRQVDTRDPRVQASLKKYWRTNVKLMGVLLVAWATIGLGCGVLFADWLNQFKLFGGFPLGFWFAQQGSIIGFVLIILIYALAMNRLDKKHHEELTRLRKESGTPDTPDTPPKARGAMTGFGDEGGTE